MGRAGATTTYLPQAHHTQKGEKAVATKANQNKVSPVTPDEKKQLRDLWAKLDKNGRQYFGALIQALADANTGVLSPKDRQRVLRAFHAKKDTSRVKVLIALGYLPEGFRPA